MDVKDSDIIKSSCYLLSSRHIPMTEAYILPISSPNNRLVNAGGKGENLSRLYRANFLVPDGFIISTKAYIEFVNTNDLQVWLLEAVAGIDLSDPVKLEAASTLIRERFAGGHMPESVLGALQSAYQVYSETPIAVRSSATAEDLPGLSFAGQQDTFLYVLGRDAFITAVKACWSSLWTARAIGYRARNKIPQADVALAVVVQKMVPAEVSGVMFTANPLTGSRMEVVIDATFGLGEALVSGKVEPDHYEVDVRNFEILSKSLGAKAMAMHGASVGGIAVNQVEAATQQAMTDTQIVSLAKLGAQVAAFYGFPQDIEWALVGGEFHLLQSRPITSLFPVPQSAPDSPLTLYFSFGAVQGILGPITPLGQDAIRLIFAGGASLFGFDVDHESQGVIKIAGERLWGNVTPIIRHPLGFRILPKAFSVIEPSTKQLIEGLRNDPNLEAGGGKVRMGSFVRLAKFLVPNFLRTMKYFFAPAGKAQEIQQIADSKNEGFAEVARSPDGIQHSIHLYREIFNGFVYAVPHFIPAMLAGYLPMIALTKISKALTGSNELALNITRGLPNNVTTNMDLALWKTAQIIRADAESHPQLQNEPASTLATEYLAGELPAAAQSVIAEFMSQYGMRGIGEIDFGSARWRNAPEHIFSIIQGYFQIDRGSAPDAIFERSQGESAAAIEELAALAGATFGGWFKSRLVRALARRMRELAGLRESPKFYIIKTMGIIREHLLASAEALVSEGVLVHAEDVFFLYLNELDAAAKGELKDVAALVAERRARAVRETLRKRIPHMLLGDGRVLYAGSGAINIDDGSLQGSPVSPGVVEGVVRVVLDPTDAGLLPGEILVCPATDPAWTPLFLAAGGLVMEMGGMMTHGAIVAREYGIPAVVGVSEATVQLRTGQRVKVDGSTGGILILGER
jgi:pyruvate,water dikinase